MKLCAAGIMTLAPPQTKRPENANKTGIYGHDNVSLYPTYFNVH